MVGKRNHPKFVGADVVNDAEPKLPEREATSPVSPGCAKLRMIAEKGECPFELGDECKAQLGSAFTCVEGGLFR